MAAAFASSIPSKYLCCPWVPIEKTEEEMSNTIKMSVENKLKTAYVRLDGGVGGRRGMNDWAQGVSQQPLSVQYG